MTPKDYYFICVCWSYFICVHFLVGLPCYTCAVMIHIFMCSYFTWMNLTVYKRYHLQSFTFLLIIFEVNIFLCMCVWWWSLLYLRLLVILYLRSFPCRIAVLQKCSNDSVFYMQLLTWMNLTVYNRYHLQSFTSILLIIFNL